MEIQRDIYLDKLKQKMHNGMIKVITGIRRCGKSYLVFNIFAGYLRSIGIDEEHIICVNLEDMEQERYREIHELYRYLKGKIKDKDKYYILIDEIQYVNRFEELLNSLLHIDNVDVYVTGSNSKFLSSDIITEFRGRGDELRVNPLSFKELYDFRKESFDTVWQEYILYGGMPAVALMDSVTEKRNYLKALFSNVYINDVTERNHLRSKTDLDDLINILASSVGSITNANKIANSFVSVKKTRINYRTIAKYINYLEDAFLLSSSMRYDINGRRYINAGLKYYFVDLGLRNARLNFRQSGLSQRMENIIYNELRIRDFAIDVGIIEANEKNSKGTKIRKQLEVDFVANMFDKRFYIQSAYDMPTDAKIKQEKRPLLATADAFVKIIIQQGSFTPWYDEDGVLRLSLKDFLLNPNMLTAY